MAFVFVVWSGLAFCLFLMVYTYLGYPALLAVITASLSAPRYDSFDQWPSVTMVVAAHNEAGIIVEKLDNIAAIDYPSPFECIVVSDSTDSTEELVRKLSGDEVTLLTLNERRGKSYAVNRAVAAAGGEVVVFSDANTMYEPDAVRELVKPLADQSVGCTTGRLRLYSEDGNNAESAYWRYELALRRLESRLGNTVSVNGGLLAVRRDEFEPLPEEALTDDFVIALQQLVAGRRVVYAPDAEAAEETAGGLWDEFDRRVRIGAGNFQTLAWFKGLLSPMNGTVAFQFMSHKALRWLMPGVIVLLLVLTVALTALSGSAVASGLLAGELFVFTLAIVGAANPRARRLALFKLPAYLLVMNLAFAVGFLQFVAGPSVDIWKPTRSR